ncbi:hypothetical protein FQZ97_1146230 [compost metagenome]
MSASKPATWRLPESVTTGRSGSVLRSLSLVERNTARRVVKRLSAESSLAPISRLMLFSGGVSTLSAPSE